MKLQGIFAVIVVLSCCIAVSADTIDTTAGLVYHLDAGAGVSATNNAVSAWSDTANPSVYTFSQATASQQPTLVAGAVNGHAAIEFTRNNGTILVSNTSSNVQTVFLVCKAGADNVNASGVWGQYGNADMGIRRNVDNTGWYSTNDNDYAYGGTMAINGVSNPQKMDGTNTSYPMAANSWGIIVATAAAQKTFDATSLGEYLIGTGRAWSGQIAEVAAFSGSLSSEQINAIGYSLSQKYGIATTYTPVPEPTSMAMILAGGLALVAYAWRKQK